MPPKTLQAGANDLSLNTSNICKVHKQTYSMICLHSNCHSCYKLICSKCKKQKHYQHPNRVISLKDFYDMLASNKMDFIQNSLGFALINIKNKLIYVSNFRVFILQKESMLMQNARLIHNTIFRIMSQKQQLKVYLERMNEDTQEQNTEQLVDSLNQLKKYIAFNPLQNVIRINSQKVGTLKVELQKYCSEAQHFINDIRQYLVKIVQVMIEEQIQQDDIQYIEHEDVDQKVFNINIKKPNHIEINQKQPKFKVQQLEQMFGHLLKSEVEKHEGDIESDVMKLEEEIKFKQEIVKNIRSRSQSKGEKNYSQSDQIKQTDSPPRKNSNSVHDSSSDHSKSIEGQKKLSKFSGYSPKNKNGKIQQKNIIKNPINNAKSPKSPKIRSITDKVNTTPKSPKNPNKINYTNAFNRNSPKSNIKNAQQSSKSQIKGKNIEQKFQSLKISNLSHYQKKMENSQGSTDFACQLIEESEQEQLLNTDTNFNVSPKKPNEVFKQQSLLLQESTPQTQQKLKELLKKVESFQGQNKHLSEQFQNKVRQISEIELKFRDEKIQMEEKMGKLQIQLKQVMQKLKNHDKKVKQQKIQDLFVQKSSQQKQQKRSVQKIQTTKSGAKKQPRGKQTATMELTLNKKILQQKKQFQMKIQKLQKQIRQVRQKQAQFKKQNQSHLQNSKDLVEIKKRNEEIIKRNQELTRKNHELANKIQQLSKKNAEQNKVHQKKINQTIQEYKRRAKQVQDQNQKLKNKVMQHQDLLKTSQSKMKSLQEVALSEANVLGDKNKQISAKIAQNEHTLQQMETTIRQMQGLIQMKQAQILQQIQTINSYDQTIKDNRNEIDSKQEIIRAKQEVIRTKQDVIEAHYEVIRGHQEIFRAKNQQITQKQQIIQSLSANIEANNFRMKEMQQIVQEYRDLFSSNSQTIKQNQQQVQNYQHLIKEKQILIEENKTKIKQKELVIIHNQKTIQTKDIQLNQAQNMLLLRQRQLDQINHLFKQRQAELKESQIKMNQWFTKLKSSQAKINELQNKLKDKHKTMTEYEDLAQMRQGEKIWLKDQEISKFQTQSKQLTQKIHQYEQITNHLQQQLKKVYNSYQSSDQSISKTKQENASLNQNLSILKEQNSNLLLKLQKCQQSLQKHKSNEKQSKKDHQKMVQQLHQQYQHVKKLYDTEKQRNEQNLNFDIKNYIPLIKYKELKQWYEITLRKNQQIKEDVHALRNQKKKIVQEYETKIKQLTEQNIQLQEKTQLNFSSKYGSLSQKGQSIPRQSTKGSSSNQILPSSVNSLETSAVMMSKYTEIRSIIQVITGDMHLLQEKVRQNTVIQKVYLKELDRKRTQNRRLRQQIEDYRTRQRKVGSIRTDRYFQKANSKQKRQKSDYKVYFATGFAGSQSRISGNGSNITHNSNNNANTQDNFRQNECKSTLSNNSSKV